MSTSKADLIDQRKANLPLPEQPPVASDWNSADERNVNVGSGAQSGPTPHLDNATDVGGGREAKDNLGGLPNDAVTREAKHKSGLAQTTGRDYGYPQKSDPSSGVSK